jgi:integrase
MAATTKTRSNDRKGRGRGAAEETGRRREGEVLERFWKRGRGFALRFRVNGERQYITLGYESEGWDWDKAETQLENELADVRRGIWVHPNEARSVLSRRGPAELEMVPIFGPFASRIVESRKGQVAPTTTADDEWILSHLLPFFAEWPIDEIDAEAVDEYRLYKVRESEARARAIERGRPQRNERNQVLRPLAPSTLNKTIDGLQWLLGIALEYGHVAENAAAGKRRRLKVEQKPPVHLDSAGQIEVLLEAAAELDRDPCHHTCDREAVVATLVFAGPRAHELCNLLWRDVDLANCRIFVGRSKTQAGLREIEIQPVLRDILARHKAKALRSGPDDLVFPNIDGGARTKDTLRRGVIVKTFKRADEMLIERDRVPLPRGLTAHKLRHTFASILVALGEDPASVMEQLGHTDPEFTLRVYTHIMRRSKEERARLKALVRGERVIALPPPPPETVSIGAYEGPIMLALAERGGRASRREIVAAIGEAMASRHTHEDLALLPSGQQRWKARFGKARMRLVSRGWIRDDSPRGQMELTKVGRAKARRDEKKAGSDQARGVASTTMREQEASA